MNNSRQKKSLSEQKDGNLTPASHSSSVAIPSRTSITSSTAITSQSQKWSPCSDDVARVLFYKKSTNLGWICMISPRSGLKKRTKIRKFAVEKNTIVLQSC